MKGALLGRAVAEKAEHHFALAADLRRPGRARGVRYARADDARSAEETMLDVGQVHRTAQALAQPVGAAVDLGHHGLRVAAEHQRIAVAAIGGERRVTVAKVTERADDGCFRAIGQMRMAADHAGVFGEGALDALFELTHAQHLGEDPDLPFGVGWLHAHSIPL